MVTIPLVQALTILGEIRGKQGKFPLILISPVFFGAVMFSTYFLLSILKILDKGFDCDDVKKEQKKKEQPALKEDDKKEAPYAL